MRKQLSEKGLFVIYAAVIGMIIGCIAWLYLKIANLGITLIWDVIPGRLNFKLYTIVMCLVGGLIVGIFHKYYGPFPESMAQSVNRMKKEGKYPYSYLPVTVLAAFLSLFFGGAVGPEAGLVTVLLGMVSWTMDQYNMGRETMRAYMDNDPNMSRGFVLKKMVRGLFNRARNIVYNKEKATWEKSDAIAAGLTTGLTALFLYELLNLIFGRSLHIPHLEQRALYTRDKVGAVLLIAIGVGAGYLFLLFRRIAGIFFSKLRERQMHVINALLGGLVLGIVGTFLPMTMFSGGNDIQAIQYEYLKYTPFLLILIGVVKLFLTNICIESGWRGGHFFPVIFSGLSIGYGFSILLNTNQIFSVVLVTTALMATMMQQPIGAIALSVICFPMQEFGWMLLAGLVGGCMPVPEKLRMNPNNKGFIYNVIHMNPVKRIAQKG